VTGPEGRRAPVGRERREHPAQPVADQIEALGLGRDSRDLELEAARTGSQVDRPDLQPLGAQLAGEQQPPPLDGRARDAAGRDRAP
jgi:hypothetical protein